MYGIVNMTLREYLVKNYGQEKWDVIRKMANVEDRYMQLEKYPDESTAAIVESSCECLDVDRDELLEGFGEFWVTEPNQSFSFLYEMGGSSFVEFVGNLNKLHWKAGRMMPEINPPTFAVTDKNEKSFTLHYRSHRPGFSSMIPGLIRGIGKRYNTDVKITHEKCKDDGHDHDEFFIEYACLE